MEQQNNEANRYKMMIAFGRVTGTTATQTIGLDIKSAQTTTTTDIKDVRITAVLLPSDADFQYAASDAQTTVQQAWADLANPQITFTPSSAGEYLILASGQHQENPNTNDSELRFVNHDGTYWPQAGSINSRYSVNGRGAMDSFFVARRENLSAAAKTFKFQFQSSGSGANAGGSTYKGLRIAAFRMDAFEAVESQVDLAEATTTSTTAVTRSTITSAVPPASRDYLVIQSAWIYDNDNGTTHQTLADFRRDGTTLSSQDHVINRDEAYQFASGCVSSMTTSNSHTFDNRYWSNNATATYIKESVIHVLRFKANAASASAGAEETQ
jgi:hypothetical protein